MFAGAADSDRASTGTARADHAVGAGGIVLSPALKLCEMLESVGRLGRFAKRI
jgi:hypothetical protein